MVEVIEKHAELNLPYARRRACIQVQPPTAGATARRLALVLAWLLLSAGLGVAVALAVGALT
jgi:hypothetical protein